MLLGTESVETLKLKSQKAKGRKGLFKLLRTIADYGIYFEKQLNLMKGWIWLGDGLQIGKRYLELR